MARHHQYVPENCPFCAADTLRILVSKLVGSEDSNDIRCPRESSFMTPCVARDGSSAVADDGVCVGCGADPVTLVTEVSGRS